MFKMETSKTQPKKRNNTNRHCGTLKKSHRILRQTHVQTSIVSAYTVLGNRDADNSRHKIGTWVCVLSPNYLFYIKGNISGATRSPQSRTKQILLIKWMLNVFFHVQTAASSKSIYHNLVAAPRFPIYFHEWRWDPFERSNWKLTPLKFETNADHVGVEMLAWTEILYRKSRMLVYHESRRWFSVDCRSKGVLHKDFMC